jgi:hypothetical protein
MDAIENNVCATIELIQQRGTVGMSIRNLMQITPTLGVYVSPSCYQVYFEGVAREVAARLGFVITG